MKFKVDMDNHGMKLETSCTTSEMCSAITAITNNVYESLSTDPVLQLMFKQALTDAFAEGLPFAPHDDVEERARINEAMKKRAKAAVEAKKESKSKKEEETPDKAEDKQPDKDVEDEILAMLKEIATLLSDDDDDDDAAE